MTANHEEVEMAQIEGVEFVHYAQAVRILEDRVRCVRVKRVENEDGSVSYEEDYSETFDVPADSVIIAIGQGPGADVKAAGIKQTQRGLCRGRYRLRPEDGHRSRRLYQTRVPAYGGIPEESMTTLRADAGKTTV